MWSGPPIGAALERTHGPCPEASRLWQTITCSCACEWMTKDRKIGRASKEPLHCSTVPEPRPRSHPLYNSGPFVVPLVPPSPARRPIEGMYSCGRNLDGELGQGRPETCSSPANVSFFVENRLAVKRIIAGHFHSLVECSAGVFACGRNNYGQLGLGKTGTASVPALCAGLDGVQPKFVAAGGCHNIVATEDNAVLTFGLNTFGQLGHSDPTNKAVPTPVEGLAGLVPIAAAAGLYHSLVLCEQPGKRMNQQKLFAFGRNDDGQLGLRTRDNSPEPQQVMPGPITADPHSFAGWRSERAGSPE